MNPVFEPIVRSSLVLVCGFVIVAAIRRQPSALKHWVLAATLALAAAQPMVNRVVPAWQPVIPQWGRISGPIREPAVGAEVSLSVPFRSGTAVAPAQRGNAIGIVLATWLGGVVVSLIVLLCGTAWMIGLEWRATQPDLQWHAAARSISDRLGLRRDVRIVVTQHPALLVTWGAIRPVILLPIDANTWSTDRIELVLAHEMAHLVRNDWLVQFFAEVARAINWFNPLFWVACTRLRLQSEYACDDIVLRLGIERTSYATHLIDLARTFGVHGRTWLPAPSIARPSTLERRVVAMLNSQLDRRPISTKRRALLAALLLAVAVPIAAASQAAGVSSGRIIDPSGKPLVGATVRLTPLDDSAAFQTTSDTNGAFRFPSVPAGDYLLAARYLGFSSQRQRIHLSGGPVFTAVTMRVGTLQETISVRGGADVVDAPRYEERAHDPGPEPCSPALTGGQLTPPMKVRDVRPRYKRAWVESGLEANILMQAQIGADGRVGTVDVIAPVNAELEDEAVAAVSQWEFSPTYLNCEAIPVTMNVIVSFKFGG